MQSEGRPQVSSEEEEGDEADDSCEEEGAEEEPKLKYQRLGGDVPGILQSDSARVLLPHSKFLVLGTHKGKVHILDLNGNSIMTRRPHNAPINDMSLDEEGEFLATCSDDGTVVVLDLWSENSNRNKHTYHMPVWAVALPSNYKSTQQFATGGANAKFVINTKSRWLVGNRDNVIHSGEGPILAIKWKGDLLAWANPSGVKVYDTVASDRVGFINRERQSRVSDIANQRCCLCWTAEDTLLIGWGDSVKIAIVKWKKGMQGGVGGVSGNRFVQIMSMFTIEDAVISGVAPFGGMIALLTTHISADANKELDEKGDFDKPELRVMSWAADDMSSDALPIYGHEYYKPNDYSLSALPGVDPIYYIISPKDIVMARPCDCDDHLKWLLERGQYAEALTSAEQNVKILRQHKVLDVGEKYLQSLMEEGKFVEAASNCPRLLMKNARLWETWISCFAQYEQLQAIAPYIPTINPQLGEPWYEMVLNFLVTHDQPGFLERIKAWSTTIYNKENVIKRVVTHLDEQKDLIPWIGEMPNAAQRSKLVQGETDLLEALSHLYIDGKQYDKAVHVYLKLGREDVFDMLENPGLIDAVRDKVLTLMQFRPEKAVQLFLKTDQVFTVDDVVVQLESYPPLLHKYLDALFHKDIVAGAAYHPQQVALYAEYEPQKLFNFLKTSNRYHLENSLKIVKKKTNVP